jgi:hypothetical protein
LSIRGLIRPNSRFITTTFFKWLKTDREQAVRGDDVRWCWDDLRNRGAKSN